MTETILTRETIIDKATEALQALSDAHALGHVINSMERGQIGWASLDRAIDREVRRARDLIREIAGTK